MRFNNVVGRMFGIVAVSMGAGMAGAGAAEPTVNDLANLQYSGVYDRPISLHDGVYEGAPFTPGGTSRPRVTLVRELTASGDLDGDGKNETAVLLAESSGGSGVFTHVAVVAQRDGGFINVGTRRLGDRVQIHRLAIEEKAVVVDLIAAGSKDAACCPTEKRHIVLRLEDHGLKAVKTEMTGQFTLADLEGETWRLVRLGRDMPVPKEVAVTATFQKGQVNGLAGCNRYFGNFSGTPYALKVGPFGATRRMCEEKIMAVEDPFLRALGHVSRISFQLGQLSLSYKTDKGVDNLVFSLKP